MIPISLSASSATCYELCPARWKAEWLHKGQGISGSAANLGSALHKVVQVWVEHNYHLDPPDYPVDVMRALWLDAYSELFPDHSRYEEGWELLVKWMDRQDWTGREVLSTETKKNFTLNTSAGPIPFNYIMDRVDRLANGDIEIIDYKSVMAPVTTDNLKERIQPRCYALAAHLEYPEARRIWVTFDLFRHDTVGVVFSREECEATLEYLHALAERILADNEPKEVLNPECRWCLRKAECETLNDHVRHAGSLIVGDFDDAVLRRAELFYAKQAIEAQISELDELIVGHLSEQERDMAEVGPYRVSLTSPRRRVVDAKLLADQLDYSTFASLATIPVTGLDEILKSGELSAEEASLLRQAISWRHSRRGVTIKPKGTKLSA